MKSPNLGHCWAHSQNKGLSKYQRRATGCGLAHPHQRQGGRWGAAKAREGQSPRDSILYQTASRLPVASQDLGFWMGDICQEGQSQRSAPQRRHAAHLRRRAHCTPRKPSSWDRGGDKTQPPPGESALSKHLVA